MKITKVSVRKFENETGNVKGIAEVTLNDCFVVKDIRIVEKPEKIVVAMPSKTISYKTGDVYDDIAKKHKDLAHPINQETRKIFNDAILGAYERATLGEYEEVVDILVKED